MLSELHLRGFARRILVVIPAGLVEQWRERLDRKFARALTDRYLLLIATPVENRLDDLFELVSLVRPGHLGTALEFRARHAAVDGEVRDLAALPAALREVMVRHRCSDLEILLPGRLARPPASHLRAA